MFPCPAPESVCRHLFHDQSSPGALHTPQQLGKNKIQLFGVIEKGENHCRPDIPLYFDCSTDETGGNIDGRLCQITVVVPLFHHSPPFRYRIKQP